MRDYVVDLYASNVMPVNNMIIDVMLPECERLLGGAFFYYNEGSHYFNVSDGSLNVTRINSGINKGKTHVTFKMRDLTVNKMISSQLIPRLILLVKFTLQLKFSIHCQVFPLYFLSLIFLDSTLVESGQVLNTSISIRGNVMSQFTFVTTVYSVMTITTGDFNTFVYFVEDNDYNPGVYAEAPTTFYFDYFTPYPYNVNFLF